MPKTTNDSWVRVGTSMFDFGNATYTISYNGEDEDMVDEYFSMKQE